MYVPVITHILYPRKGGGGKGGGGKSGGGGGGGGGSSSKGSGSGSSSSKPGSAGAPVSVSGKTGGKSSSATAYGGGGGKVSTIPAGQPFAGRSVGGGSRSQVFGSQTYGSGYPGIASRGVGGLGFPFVFWPVVWGGALGYGGAYLYDHEYGDSSNTDRPGGVMMEATFTSPTSNSTFHLLADNSTVVSLIGSVSANCTLGANSSTTPVVYNSNSTDPSQPRPEQVIQYYRASSVALTLDGYNDTSALADNQTAPDVPLPSWVDQTTLNCLNQTIGQAVPLINGAFTSTGVVPTAGTLALVWMIASYLLDY